MTELMDKSAEGYAHTEVERILPYWINDTGQLVIPIPLMRDYLAKAFCEGGLVALKTAQTRLEEA